MGDNCGLKYAPERLLPPSGHYWHERAWDTIKLQFDPRSTCYSCGGSEWLHKAFCKRACKFCRSSEHAGKLCTKIYASVEWWEEVGGCAPPEEAHIMPSKFEEADILIKWGYVASSQDWAQPDGGSHRITPPTDGILLPSLGELISMRTYRLLSTTSTNLFPQNHTPWKLDHENEIEAIGTVYEFTRDMEDTETEEEKLSRLLYCEAYEEIKKKQEELLYPPFWEQHELTFNTLQRHDRLVARIPHHDISLPPYDTISHDRPWSVATLPEYPCEGLFKAQIGASTTKYEAPILKNKATKMKIEVSSTKTQASTKGFTHRIGGLVLAAPMTKLKLRNEREIATMFTPKEVDGPRERGSSPAGNYCTASSGIYYTAEETLSAEKEATQKLSHRGLWRL